MKRLTSVAAVAAIALAASVAAPYSAVAQKSGNVHAVYRVGVEDPATGNVYYVDRKSLRSWDSETSCKNQMRSFSGFHTRAVRNVGLKNSEGTALKVEMSDMFCVTQGE